MICPFPTQTKRGVPVDIDNSLSERSIRPFTVGRSACKGFTSEEGVMIAA
ncbi:MAG: transposase, partial [Bacteroidales bacterium]|nr:transposase [Candidatus Physcocola equi]